MDARHCPKVIICKNNAKAHARQGLFYRRTAPDVTATPTTNAKSGNATTY